MASTLNTQSQTLSNSGLMQGDSALLIGTQKLDNQQNGTLYSAANLTLAIPDIRNSGLITSDIHWNQFYYVMYADSAEQKFINSQTRTDVTSKGRCR
ncbi:hypothetical protein [Raoultella terrigena]|uniref:hypothetical protein n=1 Tax=Raoultella terrigena TaxID=577 RepID=UPI00349FAEF6